MKQLFTLLIGMLLCSAATQAQGYTDTLIIPPTGMTTTTMTMTVTPSDYYGPQSPQEQTITVGNADGHVYIKGLFPDYPTAWVMGTSNDAKTQITFPQGQFVAVDFGLEIYFSGFRQSANARTDLVLQRSTTTGKLSVDAISGYCGYYKEGTAYYPFTNRYGSITITPSEAWEPATPGSKPEEKKEPIIVPEGVQWLNYTMTANNFRTGSITHPTRLAFDGDDVYMADFSNVAIQTHSYAKGHRVGNTITFPQEQFIYAYGGDHDMYLYGCTYYLGDADVQLSTLVFTYDPMTDTYTGEQGLLISDGKFRETGNFSEYLQNVVLRGLFEGVAPLSSASKGEDSAPAYDLQGRISRSAKGMLIKNGKKIIR